MRVTPIVPVLIALVSLAGCMDDGPSSQARTHEFTLEVSSAGQNIPLYTLNDGRDMRVAAVGFQVPGQEALVVPNPEIRVMEGDTVILHVVNNNPLPHTLHLHGGLVPWEMDGVPFLNQEPILTGQTFTYVFKDLKAGSYFYHCHVDVAHHMDLGMYGGFIVEERDPDVDADKDIALFLDEWDNCHVHGNTDPLTGTEQNGDISDRAECLLRVTQDTLAMNQNYVTTRETVCNTLAPPDPVYTLLNCGVPVMTPLQAEREWYPVTHPVYEPEYNTFLINGKAFPDTVPIAVDEGDKVRLRLMNVGDEMHAMHIHGHNMLVTHRDGYPVPAPFRIDTLGIMPGERYDVIIEADNPGLWAFHDHVGLNTRNDLHAPGGMFTCIAYDGFHGVNAYAMDRAIQCMDEARAILAAA